VAVGVLAWAIRRPDGIAKAALLLVRGATSFITGLELLVGGGVKES
jgi:hypothetical protein